MIIDAEFKPLFLRSKQSNFISDVDMDEDEDADGEDEDLEEEMEEEAEKEDDNTKEEEEADGWSNDGWGDKENDE